MGNQANLSLLTIAARKLKPLLDDLVFVGGSTTSLLITDAAAADVRPTYDVDAITEVSSYLEYSKFADRLRIVGFKEDQRDNAPMCRWVGQGIMLDVMPDDPSILGFSNRWYKDAVRTANRFCLEEELNIRIVTAPYFLGTKLEAFKGRGNGDFVMSPDLEDIISVVDGRPELFEEIRKAQPELKAYIALELGQLLENRDFVAALPGFLSPDQASQQRHPSLLGKLTQIASAPS